MAKQPTKQRQRACEAMRNNIKQSIVTAKRSKLDQRIAAPIPGRGVNITPALDVEIPPRAAQWMRQCFERDRPTIAEYAAHYLSSRR